MKWNRRREGVTYLEIQVSLVVLGIALAGICPLVVMQLKLLRRIESKPIGSGNFQVIRGQRIIDGEPYATEGDFGSRPVTVLQPAADPWMRRLGTAAPFQDLVKSQASPPLLTEATIDDNDATLVGDWTDQAAVNAKNGTCHALESGNPTGSATWTFGSIVPDRYRIMISWPTTTPIPDDATFTFTDAAANIAIVPAALTTQIDDGPWRDLGNHSLGSSLELRLTGSNTGQVIADAARIGSRNTVTISSLANTASPPSSEVITRRAKVVRRP